MKLLLSYLQHKIHSFLLIFKIKPINKLIIIIIIFNNWKLYVIIILNNKKNYNRD